MREILVGLCLSVCLGFPVHAEEVLSPTDDEGAGGALSVEIKPRKWLREAAKGWMGRLPDHLSIAELSLPGTHDTGAWQGGVGCRVQSWPLEQQIAAGIR